MSTSGIVALLLVSLLIQHPMSSGIVRSRTFHISEYLAVRLMFTSRRSSEQVLDLIWRNASLLDIHRATRAGHSTIQLPNELSSQNELNLMNGTFLALNEPHSLQNHLSRFLPSHLFLHRIQREIATQTTLQRIHYIHN